MIKPLFVPLSAHWYEQFEQGAKQTEFRIYGRGWTEVHCWPGRPAVLSYGYGKKRRLCAVVERFDRLPARELAPEDQAAVISVYGHLDLQIAAITFKGIRSLGEGGT